MSLGKRLRKARENKGWTQVYAAKLIGVTNQVLSNYERDYRDPDTETLNKMAQLYGVSSDALLGIGMAANDPSNRYYRYDGQTYDLEEIIDRGHMITVDGKPISPDERERLKEHLKVAIRTMRERKNRQG